MTTFTKRDLDRDTRAVLAAADAEGCVLVETREGRRYQISPVLPESLGAAGDDDLAEFQARVKSIWGPKPLTAKQDAALVEGLKGGR
jgi:hypothetical protein